MKNTMKTLVAVLCLTALFTGATLQAQDAGRSGERQNELLEKLDLSDNQMTKFTDIQKKYRAEISELRGKGRNKENKEKIRSLNTKKENELKSILTEEQYTIYETYSKKGRRSKSGNRN